MVHAATKLDRIKIVSEHRVYFTPADVLFQSIQEVTGWTAKWVAPADHELFRTPLASIGQPSSGRLAEPSYAPSAAGLENRPSGGSSSGALPIRTGGGSSNGRAEGQGKGGGSSGHHNVIRAQRSSQIPGTTSRGCGTSGRVENQGRGGGESGTGQQEERAIRSQGSSRYLRDTRTSPKKDDKIKPPFRF